MKAALVLFVVIGLIIVACGIPYWTADTVTITVTDKERINGKDSSKYLIFTESETFENTDCISRWKFASSDLQGKLKIGGTYKVLVYGWRLPLLSSYRNIVRIEQ